MSDFKIELEHPWLLLLLIPVLFFSFFPFFRLSKKYRRNRNRIISVVTHTLAMVLCVAMVAGMTFTYELPNRQNELIVLVDRSDSGTENESLRVDTALPAIFMTMRRQQQRHRKRPKQSHDNTVQLRRRICTAGAARCCFRVNSDSAVRLTYRQTAPVS